MTEFWVPYGAVEVSFDIRQENLSQVLEPHPTAVSQEEIEKKLSSLTSCETLLLLSGTKGTQKVLDSLLRRARGVKKIVHPKGVGSVAKKIANELKIEVEQLRSEDQVEAGTLDGAPLRIERQIKEATSLVTITSIHNDVLFGLTSAASDLLSLNQERKAEAFKRAANEIPCSTNGSVASWFAMRFLQNFPNINVIEIVESTSQGVLNVFSGEPEASHSKASDYWQKALEVKLSSRLERLVFGAGGLENDQSFSNALSRSFFNIVSNAALKDGGAKLCMLAECSQGLGSEALLRYVTGRLTPGSSLDSLGYFEGLEVLLSFYKVQRDLELSMISTLPRYYAKKFDFNAFSASRDAPSTVLAKGSRAKTAVVPDGSTTYFTS